MSLEEAKDANNRKSTLQLDTSEAIEETDGFPSFILFQQGSDRVHLLIDILT